VVFGFGGGKITKRMLLAMLIVFNIALLSLGEISATTETVNVTDSNLTPEISENTTNITTTNSTNTTNLTNSGDSETNSNNNTVNIQTAEYAAGDNYTNINYTNITGIWLRSDSVSTLDVDALLKANITDIFVKINSTNYQSVLDAILIKVKGTAIRINAWITCFQTTSSNGTTEWIDPQGTYSYQVSIPYTATVQTPYQQWYKGWYTKAYTVKVKKWYKSGKKWKYYWTYQTRYKKVYGWTTRTAYTTSYVTKYNYETRYGQNTTYNDNLINFISNVTTNYNINGIHLDYVRYPGTAYKYANATETITSFVKQVYTTVKSINPSVAVSAALMPEGSVNAYYYGQNYTQLAPYLDFMVPMIYKGNYGYNSSTGTSSSGKNGTYWIGSTVAYIVSQANGTPVVAGLQTYRSDNNVTPIPASELQNDINAAISNGSSGYALFRYGLIDSGFMATKSVSGQSSTINDTSTNSTSTFTLTEIQNAAASVKSFIESNNKLPNYVTIGTSQITMPQFLQMLVTGLLQINSGINTPISAENVSDPANSTGSYIYGNIYTTEYLSIAQSIKTFIDSNNMATNYTSSSLGNIQYETLVYMFSKILNYYGTNSRLPNYVSVDSTIANPGSYSIPSDLQQYLQATANCQVNDPAIIAKAAQLTAGLTSTYDKAVAIFNWIRDHLGYSFYYNTKYGAVGTLNAGTGNCVDTSHLLIALERAAGIPARYEHVYAQFSSGSWYGHVIAQVWVNGVWYNADGTSTRNTFGVINNWNTATATYYGTYASLPF
jgi:transglutaminase-like putative cysteine protease